MLETYYVYCLYSEAYDKIYIGFTRDLHNRMLWHNEKSQRGYTPKYRPWKVVYTEVYETESAARAREVSKKLSRKDIFKGED